MTLHHRDGRQLEEPREWIEEQLHLVHEWNLPEFEKGLSEEEVLFAWVDFFAKWVREICDRRNVDVETFDGMFSEFERRVTPHIETLKWMLSKREGRDVGLHGACLAIRTRAVPIVRGKRKFVRFTMTFPSIGEGGNDHTESMEFPIEEVPCQEEENSVEL